MVNALDASANHTFSITFDPIRWLQKTFSIRYDRLVGNYGMMGIELYGTYDSKSNCYTDVVYDMSDLYSNYYYEAPSTIMGGVAKGEIRYFFNNEVQKSFSGIYFSFFFLFRIITIESIR